MRPTIYRPSKRYYTSLGERIVTVIGVFFLVLTVTLAVFLYKLILPWMQPTERPQNTATQVQLVHSTHRSDSNKSVRGSRFLGNDFGNRGSGWAAKWRGASGWTFSSRMLQYLCGHPFRNGSESLSRYSHQPGWGVTRASPCACLSCFMSRIRNLVALQSSGYLDSSNVKCTWLGEVLNFSWNTQIQQRTRPENGIGIVHRSSNPTGGRCHECFRKHYGRDFRSWLGAGIRLADGRP